MPVFLLMFMLSVPPSGVSMFLARRKHLRPKAMSSSSYFLPHPEPGPPPPPALSAYWVAWSM